MGTLERKMRAEIRREDTCELCGYRSNLGAIDKRYIVPIELTEQAGVARSQIFRLCQNCNKELDIWYSSKIVRTSYDASEKRFTPKSTIETVKEYQSAFKAFIKYKKD